jgi:hypothetical protein
MERHCLDNHSNQSAVFSDDVYNQRQHDLFMPIAFVIMLVVEIALAVIYSIRKKSQVQKESS